MQVTGPPARPCNFAHSRIGLVGTSSSDFTIFSVKVLYLVKWGDLISGSIGVNFEQADLRGLFGQLNRVQHQDAWFQPHRCRLFLGQYGLVRIDLPGIDLRHCEADHHRRRVARGVTFPAGQQ